MALKVLLEANPSSVSTQSRMLAGMTSGSPDNEPVEVTELPRVSGQYGTDHWLLSDAAEQRRCP